MKVTGSQVKDYLEFSARYFQQVSGTGPFTMAQVTNAVTATAPNGTPDYNFDSIAGLAGRALRFACKVTEVRAASAEEIAHRHVHGGHGHHH